MKVHVEAKPLHEPLAGGTPGATVAVEPMVAGRVTWSRWMMESPGGRLLTLKLLRALITGEPATSVPCPAFLIRHPSAGAILVDTGLHPSDRHRRRRRTSAGSAPASANPSLEPGEDVPAQLRKRGLEPGEVPIVVMTHMHIDHTSAISEFPHATFVVSEVEWNAATTGPSPLLNGYRRPTTTTPSTTARSTSTAAASTPTRASAAPTTSSATARSASPSPRATAPGTCR